MGCRRAFGGRNLISRGYQPIQIYIMNNSNKSYYLDPNSITLPIEPGDKVSRKIHRDLGWKTAKYYLIGGPIWAIIEYIFSNEANKSIDADFKERTINPSRGIRIRPYETINKVIFVANENYTRHFGLTLTENKSKKQIEFKF